MSDPTGPEAVGLFRLSESHVRRPPTFSVKWAEHERALEQLRVEHERAMDELRHQQTEVVKDNAQRRTIVNAVGIILIGMLALSFVVAIWAENDGTRDWAQSLVTVILGGIVGGMAGYLTGRSTR